ncbi:MAG: c-type cytochrome [Planctomycetes bacterium]|nr:c-type cytochrome [Planctomycetota bacterium]
MQVGLRKVLMAALVAAFVGQTTLVYTDDTADRTPPLSELAIAGRRIWHDNNCQACHQIYGFGGFLGPDLTNAARRLSREYLTTVLTTGPNNGQTQMPAFHMDEDQIAAVREFLQELDQTGIGVPRAKRPPAPTEVFAAIRAHLDETSPAAEVGKGLSLFQPICGACHTPFQATPLGPNTAPDLSTVVTRLDDDAIRATIENGRVARGMPAQPHMKPSFPQLLALLHWLQQERAAITARLGGPADDLSLPWWEFK